MRAPLVLTFLVAILAAAATLAWLSMRDRPADAALHRAAAAPVAGPGQHDAGEEPPAPVAGVAPGAADAPLSPAPTPVSAAPARSAVPVAAEPARVVHGHVELSSDCAREDGLLVFALDREATAGQLALALFVERHGEPARNDDDDDDDDAEEAFGGEEQDPAAGRPVVLARATLDAEGRFELRVPGERELVHLGALGRFAYLAETRPVELGPEPEAVSVELSCGAELLGRLALPPGQQLEELEGTDVRAQLAALGRPGGRTPRPARAAADGRFQIAALPTWSELELLAMPEEHAYARLSLGRLEPGESHEVVLELSRGARVIGVVLDEAGNPLAKARVSAMPAGSLFDLDWATRSARADAEGRFDLSGLPPGKIMLRAHARGFLESELTTLDVGEGGTISGVELRLSGGAAIAGTVRWPDGRPAEGAGVRARFDPSRTMGMGAYSAMRGSRGDARTDENGRFRVRGLGRGPFVLTVQCKPPEDPGAEPWSVHVGSTAPDGPELDLVLGEPEGVAGRVTDVDGHPLERFRIVAMQVMEASGFDIGIDELGRSFEDPDGRFRLQGMAHGKWRVFALADGFARGGPVVTVVPRAEGAEPALFALERAARAEGTVLGFDGLPVGEAEVTVSDGQPAFMRAMSTSPPPPTARTDAAGRFVLEGLTPGEVALVARSDAFASSLPRKLSLAPGEGASGLELVLREGGRIAGEVFSADGSPAAGTTVQLLNMGDMDWRFERTDAEGRFLATRLDPGNWRALHMPRGFGTESFASADAAELDMGELMKDMAVAMADVKDGETTHIVLGTPPEDPVRLTGRVSLAGEPYSGALLSFYREGTRAFERMRATSTKEDGSFEVVLDAPGMHLANVQMLGERGGEQSTVELVVDVPEVPEHSIEIELPGGRISGRLVAPAGESSEGVRVTLIRAGPQESGLFFGGQYAELSSDGEGRYEVVGLRAGTYYLAAGGMAGGGLFGGEAAFAREIRPIELKQDEHARGVDFRLRKPGKLSVRVVDELDEPVAGAAIFVREAATGTLVDRFALLTTGAQGAAEYGGLLEGGYTVSARKAERASQETPPVSVRPGEPAAVRVVLEEGTILRLELLDEEGAPLRAAYSVRDGDGREYQGMFAMEDVTLLMGAEALSWHQPRVGPLPPGSYVVRAETEDGRSAERPVHLRGQRERTVRLRLR